MRLCRRRTPLKILNCLLAGASVAIAGPALAQTTSMPGLSVELPPQAEESAPPTPAPQKPRQAKPKTPAKEAAASAKTSASEPERARAPSQSIAALVNDEPITAYEIDQRQRLLGMGANLGDRVKETFQNLIKNPAVNERLKAILNETIQANKGKSKDEILAVFEQRKKAYAQSLQRQAVESARQSVLPGLRKQALEELVDERLKLQEAKRLNVLATDADVDQFINNIAQRNKMTLAQFADHLKGMGADINSMRSRFRAELSWRDVVRRRFGHQISITERDVDRMVATTPKGEDDVELQLQRITLPMTGKFDQKVIAQRLSEAEGIAAKFTGCANASVLAASVSGAKFEDLGSRKPSTIPEPTRSLLLSAGDGNMLPPSVGQGGVELWSVCGRKVLKADEERREMAQAELRAKEFDVLAKKHLKDLRQDAAIEYR